MSKIKAIIPAAGFGTRVNMAPNQSKELLPVGPFNDPLIEWTIWQCWENDLNPCVLVRPEKTDLIRYLATQEVEVVIMEPGKEWAETVFNSREHWAEKNILMLPDTRFEPIGIIHQMKASLNFGSQVVFALHEVDDVSKWGYVDKTSYCEKPINTVCGQAWGLIGFTQSAGHKLFKQFQTKGEYYHHNYNFDHTQFFFLKRFQDLTRKL